jgi:hypothetical protein
MKHPTAGAVVWVRAVTWLLVAGGLGAVGCSPAATPNAGDPPQPTVPASDASGGRGGGAGGAPPATGPGAPSGSGGGTGGTTPMPPGSDLPPDAGTSGQPPSGSSPPPPAGWWDAKWQHRAQITINDPEAKEALSDFQVGIKLDPAVFDFKAAKPAGEDLRFVGADGQILHHQIDVWDPAGALVWLRVPALAAGTPLSLWLYYGNADAAAPDDAANEASSTWPAPYRGVWHLSGDGKDSTANHFDGAQMVGGSFTEAKFGKGLTLDGSKREHITLKADIKILAGATGCTFSAWIKPSKPENSINGMIIMTLGKWFNNNHNSYADFNVNAAGQMISHIDPGTNAAASGYARILSDPGFIKADEWAWVTYVIDLANDEERFFKNGLQISTKKPPNGKFSAASFIDMVSTRVVIGAEEDVVSHWWTGSMDELRIETGMRSPAWIAAQYRAMTTPNFVTVSKDR